MSTYAIQAVSSPQTVIAAHEKRGFDVVTVAAGWDTAQALAKSLGVARDTRHLMVASTLARRLHEARRAHRPAFERPTLVVMPAQDEARLGSVDWQRVQQAAAEAETDVVFLHAQL